MVSMNAPPVTDPAAEEELAHLYRLVYDDLRFCGCGEPGDAYDLVRDLLGLAPFYDNPGIVRERIGGSDGAFYLVLYLLDGAGLIEHGGVIGGAWLMGKGKHYLGLMQRHAWEAVDESGYPHDGAPCPDNCPYKYPED